MLLFPVTPAKQKELEDRMKELGVDEQDIDEQFVRGSGHGGQKINKTSSCVYLCHRPTGLAVKCQKGRSQALNRFHARRMLLEKIERMQKGIAEEAQTRIERIRRQKKRRSRRAKERMLADKKLVGRKKGMRGRVTATIEE